MVSLNTKTSVDGVVPKSTAVAPMKLVPVIIIEMVPNPILVFGLMLVTVGAMAAVYVN